MFIHSFRCYAESEICQHGSAQDFYEQVPWVNGPAVVCMHCVGNMAVRVSGEAIWNYGIIIAPWVVECVTAVVAFFTIFVP